MGTTSKSSSLRNGGKPLRLAYPIHGRNTFRPSGNPATDEPEREKMSELEWHRRALGIETPEGMRAFDGLLESVAGDRSRPGGIASKEATAYWDKLRFLQEKSPRARKRAEERERRAKRISAKEKEQSKPLT
jgi:hypothetical protein